MSSNEWHTSSYSGNEGHCVEVAWHTSSYSGAQGGECVEVAEGTTTAIRDTRNRHLGHLHFPAHEWTAFLTSLRNGEL